jgi:hypothetical protein
MRAVSGLLRRTSESKIKIEACAMPSSLRVERDISATFQRHRDIPTACGGTTPGQATSKTPRSTAVSGFPAPTGLAARIRAAAGYDQVDLARDLGIEPCRVPELRPLPLTCIFLVAQRTGPGVAAMSPVCPLRSIGSVSGRRCQSRRRTRSSPSPRSPAARIPRRRCSLLVMPSGPDRRCECPLIQVPRVLPGPRLS